jgi:hypothetical protein
MMTERQVADWSGYGRPIPPVTYQLILCARALTLIHSTLALIILCNPSSLFSSFACFLLWT